MNGVGPYVNPRMQVGIVASPSHAMQQRQHPSGASTNVNGWNKKYSDKQREHDIRRERKLERERIREREVREREQQNECPVVETPHIPQHNSRISPQGQGVPHHHTPRRSRAQGSPSPSPPRWVFFGHYDTTGASSPSPRT